MHRPANGRQEYSAKERGLETLVLDVLKRVIEELETEIQLLETGNRAIADIKAGRIVDASREALSEKRVHRDRVSELVSRLEAANAKRA